MTVCLVSCFLYYFVSLVIISKNASLLLPSGSRASGTALPARGASVRESPERFRDPVSRLRVQRYANFSIPASVSQTFLSTGTTFFTRA